MSETRNSFDLSGHWHGTYTYPRDEGPATPFLASVDDRAGSISGTIIEPDTIHSDGKTLEAVIVGHRSGRSVDFTKSYRGRRRGYENPVDYVGQLSTDGQSLAGVWSLLDMNGTFEMFREEVAEEPIEAEIAEEVLEPAEPG